VSASRGWRDRPLAAFAELRARLVWRRLVARGGTAELVARALGFLVLVPIGLLAAGAIAAGTWRTARFLRGGLESDAAVTAIFIGIWQAWTALTLSMQEQETIDLRRFLLYPLRPGQLWLYGQAASVLGDPFALFWCLLLGGAFTGAAVGRPGAWLAPLGLVFLLFAAGTLAWLALLQELMARFLRSKRLKSVLFAALYAAIAVMVGYAWGLEKVKPNFQQVLAALSVVQWVAWPGALAAMAGRSLFAGRALEAISPILGLASATWLAGWWAYRLALAEARSGGEGARRQGPAASASRVFRQARARGALLERELLFLWRHPLPMVLALILPVLAGVLAWKALPSIPAEAGEVVKALPLIGVALYTHLTTQVFWLNAFGWERGGGRLLFLAPIDLRDVLVAKNLAIYLLSAVIQLLAAGAMVAVAGAPPAWALLAAVALHAGSAPWLMGLGNLVSILNPRAASLVLQRSGTLPALSTLAGMGIISAVTGLFALPAWLAVVVESGWLLPALWTALGVVGWAAWWMTLPRAASLLAAHREPLLAAVTGDEA
jgi:ABC-2 type transport system permease protein